MPEVHWIFFDLPYWMRFWENGRRGEHLYYYLWQLAIYFVIKRIHKKEKFDLVHHVTFACHWMPCFLALLNLPLLWSPVGGGETAPKPFYQTSSYRARIYEYLRDFARWQGEINPFVRLTASKAKLGLAATTETEARMKLMGCKRVRVLPSVALSEEDMAVLLSLAIRRSSPFRFLSVGRLLHFKGFHLELEAFSRFQKHFPASEYWVIGDGPEIKSLRHLADILGISQKVIFWGILPGYIVLEKLGHCDVLVHPSLHESVGCVILEAMAAGRPAICLNIGGPALQITDKTGFKIEAINP